MAAWTFTNGALKHTWTFDSAAPGWEAYSGMGNHSVTVADFDGDGCDEICVGAMTVDHDGDVYKRQVLIWLMLRDGRLEDLGSLPKMRARRWLIKLIN